MPGRTSFASRCSAVGVITSSRKRNRSKSNHPRRWTVTGNRAVTRWKSWSAQGSTRISLPMRYPNLCCIGVNEVTHPKNLTPSLFNTSASSGHASAPAWSTALSPSVSQSSFSRAKTRWTFCDCVISILTLRAPWCLSLCCIGATQISCTPPGTANSFSM